MSNPIRSKAAPTSPQQEDLASLARVPIWLFVLLFLLTFWGMYYFDQNSGWFNVQVYTPYRSVAELKLYQPPAGGGNERGKAVYENICALCHNVDGMGKPNQAPPLVGSEWVLGSPTRMARIPLAGLAGPITIKGVEWNLAMPAMGAALSDDDLSAVLTYMRQSWGNKASAITPEQVKAVRAELSGRSQPFTSDQLQQIP
ncbi:MAG: cytochrome c [Verrucomicrobiota bacterium]|nr:cytochrome c [Verrucomicrobiota bacterium]